MLLSKIMSDLVLRLILHNIMFMDKISNKVPPCKIKLKMLDY